MLMFSEVYQNDDVLVGFLKLRYQNKLRYDTEVNQQDPEQVEQIGLVIL